MYESPTPNFLRTEPCTTWKKKYVLYSIDALQSGSARAELASGLVMDTKGPAQARSLDVPTERLHLEDSLGESLDTNNANGTRPEMGGLEIMVVMRNNIFAWSDEDGVYLVMKGLKGYKRATSASMRTHRISVDRLFLFAKLSWDT